ncbi:MAG: hypothetical protein V1872_14955, partial [bacterium]
TCRPMRHYMTSKNDEILKLLTSFMKVKPSSHFDQEEGVALVSDGVHLIFVCVEGNTYYSDAVFHFHIFTPRGTELGEARSLKLEGFSISPTRERIFVWGDSVVICANDANDKPVMLDIGITTAKLHGKHSMKIKEWEIVKFSGKFLFQAVERGAKVISVWKHEKNGLVLENKLKLNFNDWTNFAVSEKFIMFIGDDYIPTRFFKFDDHGELILHSEMKGKFNQQSYGVFYPDEIAILYGAHKKVYLIDTSKENVSLIGQVMSVANTYENAVRFNNLVLLCDANQNDAPTLTVESRMDVIQIGLKEPERIAIKSPIYVLDAVRLPGAIHFLTPKGLVSFAIGGE